MKNLGDIFVVCAVALLIAAAFYGALVVEPRTCTRALSAARTSLDSTLVLKDYPECAQ